MDLPYLVKNQQEAYRLLDGPVVRQEMDQKAGKGGFHVVHHWKVTFRNIYTRAKPIESLADVKGLKIRVIQSPSFVTLFRTLGASPTPMALGSCTRPSSRGRWMGPRMTS